MRTIGVSKATAQVLLSLPGVEKARSTSAALHVVRASIGDAESALRDALQERHPLTVRREAASVLRVIATWEKSHEVAQG